MKSTPNACQTSAALSSAAGGILRYKDAGQAARAAQSLPDHVTVENGAGTTMVMSRADAEAFKELGWKVGGAVTERERDSEYTANLGMSASARMATRAAGVRKPGWYVLDGDRIVAGPFDTDAKAMPSWKPGLKLKKLTGEGVNEGLRLAGSFSNGSQAAKVYKDSEWGEYRVKFYKDGVHQAKADYHTDDKEDAVQTAKAQIGLKESGPAQRTSGFQAGATVMVPGRRLGTVVKANAVERTVTVELNGSKRKADYGYKELRKVKPDHQLPPVTRDDRVTSHFADAKTETDARAPRDVPAKSLVQRMKDAEKSMMTARQQGRHTDAAGWRNKRDSLKAMIARRVAGAAPKAESSTKSESPEAKAVAEAAIRVSPEQLDTLWDKYAKAELECLEAGDVVSRAQRMRSSRALNDFRRACQASNLDPVREVARRMTIPVSKAEGSQAPAGRHEPGTTLENGVNKIIRSKGDGPRFVAVVSGEEVWQIPRWDGPDSDLAGLSVDELEAQGFRKSALKAADLSQLGETDGAGVSVDEVVSQIASGQVIFAIDLAPAIRISCVKGKWSIRVANFWLPNASEAVAREMLVQIRKEMEESGQMARFSASLSSPAARKKKGAKTEGYEGPGWYVLNSNGDILSPQFDFQSDAQTFQDEHLPAGDTHVSRVDDAGEPVGESAPPGMEDEVLALKKKYPADKAFAIAWSRYNAKKKKKEASESAGHVVRMSSGAYVIADSPTLGPDSKVRDDTGSWIPVSGLVHGSDWEGIKFPDEASARAELGEAGANYPSPEAYGRFGAAEDSTNHGRNAQGTGNGTLIQPAGSSGEVHRPEWTGSLKSTFPVGSKVVSQYNRAVRYTVVGHVNNGMQIKNADGDVTFVDRTSARDRFMMVGRKPTPDASEATVISNPSGFVRVRGSEKPAMEGRKVQSKFAGTEVDLDRWYVVSDAARFLTPESFATEQEALDWVRANPDGIDLDDGDAVMKGEQFVEIYDEAAPVEEASDASFKKWLKKNRNDVVVGTVESDYGTTWLVGSKTTGWGFLDLVGYWSHETGPEFSADMSPMEDSDVILEPEQEIEHSDVDALLAAMDEAGS